MTQQSLEEYGYELAAKGHSLALANTDPEWKIAAMDEITRLAKLGYRFTSEDIRRKVGPPPASPNAMGALFGAARKKGIIKKTGRLVAPSRPELHGSPLFEWTAP